MKISTGVDLVEIERFREILSRHGSRFLDRIYTNRELDEVGEDLASLAARFAAKEAVSKALGTGIGPVSWKEIEILRGKKRNPILNLHGKASQQAQFLNLESWSISLSHTSTYAVASVFAVGTEV